MILETLYLPRVKDQLAGLNQRRWTYVYDVSAADTVFNSGSVAAVPVDTLRMVETLGYWIVPGGVLTATDVMFYCSAGNRYIGSQPSNRTSRPLRSERHLERSSSRAFQPCEACQRVLPRRTRC